MTDNEIIKALECCVSEQYTCEQCPYQEIKHYDYDNGFEIMPNGKQYDDWSCERWLNTDLLDLINRQKAELDDLKRDYLPRCKDALRRANEIGMALEKENQELREEIERLQKEIKTTRAYIHDNGLEWDLPSYSKRNGW